MKNTKYVAPELEVVKMLETDVLLASISEQWGVDKHQDDIWNA